MSGSEQIPDRQSPRISFKPSSLDVHIREAGKEPAEKQPKAKGFQLAPARLANPWENINQSVTQKEKVTSALPEQPPPFTNTLRPPEFQSGSLYFPSADCPESSDSESSLGAANVAENGDSDEQPAAAKHVPRETRTRERKSPSAKDPSFIFGQNLADRAVVPAGGLSEYGLPESSADEHSSMSSNPDDISPLNDNEPERKKTLLQSAEEYVSRQQQRRLEEVQVRTGEEGESNVLQIYCKLYQYVKENQSWSERGRGLLRLNDVAVDEDGCIHSRLVMRCQGSLRLILNSQLFPGMKLERASEKAIRFNAQDEEQIKVYLIMMDTKDIDCLYCALESRLQRLNESKKVAMKRSGGAGEDSTNDDDAASKKQRGAPCHFRLFEESSSSSVDSLK